MSFTDNDNGKFSALSASSHGSLSSITTTSIASSEDPKAGDNDDGKGFDRRPSKSGSPIKQEEWWKTTLQVSIPFLVAGIGTIGAGVVLGRVEVSLFISHNIIICICQSVESGTQLVNGTKCLKVMLSIQYSLRRHTSLSLWISEQNWICVQNQYRQWCVYL